MAVQNNGGEFQEYQSAQNQLLNIRAQQDQNLNEQRVMAQSDASTNNVLYQAAGLMADNTNTETAANFNPQTQAVLNQYGLGQPRIQKSSSSQNSTQQVSKQNIIINNNYKTENTTTNNVTVPSGGPIQGRPVTIGDNGIGKFKVWLNTTFAQQQEAAARRDREYEIRQANLSKDSNKLMRKLELVGTNIGKALDPRRISQATMDPTKMLFNTLGIVMIAKNWPKIMEFVNKADNFFNGGKLTELLGGKKGETPGKALKELLVGEDGVWGRVKRYLDTEKELRRVAMKNVPKPDIKFWTESLGETIGKMGTYISNILQAVFNPEASVEDAASIRISRDVIDTSSQKYREEHRTKGDKTKGGGVYSDYHVADDKGNERSVDRGDFAIIEGTYRGVPEYHLNNEGQLIGTPGSTVSQSNDIVRMIEDASNGNYVSSMAVVEGLSRLENVLKSNRNKEVIVSRDFINKIKTYFNINKDEQIGKEIQSGEYVYVPRKIKTRQQGEEQNHWLRGMGGVLSRPIYDSIVNGERIELVNKKDLTPEDKPLDKLPENLFALTENDLQKITKAIIGENATDLSVKNTNSELQHAMLDYFRKQGFKTTNAADSMGLGTFDTNMMPIEEYRDLETELKNNRQEINNNDRVARAGGEVSDLYKSTTKSIPVANLETYKDRVKKALDFFMNDKELGLNESQAKAIVANLIEESNINPSVENGNGIAQWSGDRKKHLLNYYNQNNNTSETDFRNISLEDQLSLVKYELLNGDMKNFFAKFKEGYTENGQRVSDLDAFMRGYELGGNAAGTLASVDWINSDKIVSQNSGLTYDGHLGRRTQKLNALSTFTIEPENVSLATVSPQVITKPDLVTQDATDFVNLYEDKINSVQNNPNIDPETKQLLEQLHIDLLAVIDGTRTIDENMVNKMVEQINAILQSNNQPPININQTQSYTS